MSRLFVLAPALVGVLLGPAPAAAARTQSPLRSQSALTPADADPDFRLTLDHLGGGSRVFGLAPRDLRWAPDGSEVYFRWNESPAPGQLADDDPWFAVDRAGRTLRELSVDEIRRVPAREVVRSLDGSVSAWSSSGTLFVRTKAEGARPVYAVAGEIGALRLRPDGSALHFATAGLTPAATESGDLWEYDFGTGLVRQVAAAFPAEEEDSKQQAWLEEQQTELVSVVRERKAREERRGDLRRIHRAAPPQRVPVPKGERLLDFRLSPDGRFLVFRATKAPAEPMRTEFMEFVNESGRATKKDARPKVGEELPSWRLGIVAVDPAVRPEDLEIRWVEDGEERATVIHGPDWSPDGRHAAVQMLSMDHKDRWISLLDLEAGTLRHLDHQTEEAWIGGPLVEGRWRPGMLAWLPDSEGLVFGSMASGWAMLQSANPEGEVSALTEGAFEVRRAELAPDGQSFFLTTSREHPGEEHLYRLPARGGPPERLTGGEAMHSWEVSPDGGRVAFVRQSLTELGDLYLMDAEAGAEPVRVTKSGTDAFYRTAWAGSEIVEYDLPDGNTAWARIWDAPEGTVGAVGAVAGQTPAVVYAHGCGECAQAVVKGWNRLGSIVYANYLRQRGYVAASVDYRGSSGYGHRNRTYAYRQMGVSDIDSALPLLDLLVERRGAARERIGVYGGSYGGFFTLMSLFRHPGAYAAGVALYPVTDWVHYNQGYTSRILNGSQLDDEEAYRVSPGVLRRRPGGRAADPARAGGRECPDPGFVPAGADPDREAEGLRPGRLSGGRPRLGRDPHPPRQLPPHDGLLRPPPPRRRPGPPRHGLPAAGMNRAAAARPLPAREPPSEVEAVSRRDPLIRAPGSRARRSPWAAFRDGVGSIFDLYGRRRRPRPRSDAEAMRHDWQMVGQDLHAALAQAAHRDEDLRRRLAGEAGEKHDLLVKLLPEAARKDPRLYEALRAAADQQKRFRQSLDTGVSERRGRAASTSRHLIRSRRSN